MRLPYQLLIVLIAVCLVPLMGHAQVSQPISMLAPGENSLVTAPIAIEALVNPGEDDLIRVSLVDRNQNVLARQLIRLDATFEGAIEFKASLPFEIPTETSTAILTVATQDHLHRPLSLRSVQLNLANGGAARIEPSVSADDWLSLTAPRPGAVITQSPLMVSGTVVPFNNNPVIFELLTERGGAIVSKQLLVETAGQEFAFEISLPYPPPAADRDMRLVVRQSSGLAGVDAILDSLPIVLSP